MIQDWQARVLCLALLTANGSRAEPPTTREAVHQVVERSKKGPNILLELKGASLDVIMPEMRELWSIGEHKTQQWMACRQAGKEKEFFEMEANSGRDHDYLAKAYPLAREVLISHPDFEWTLRSKFERMSYLLNKAQTDDYVNVKGAVEANGDYRRDLDFATRIPGDAAIRIIGPFLNSPYYPRIDMGDVTEDSPASNTQFALARLLKERYGEDLPKDIEAARAWWKANEHRFAAKGAVAPQINKAGVRDSPLLPEPKSQASPKQETDFQPPSEMTSREIRWPIPVAILSALLAMLAWFFRRKQ